MLRPTFLGFETAKRGLTAAQKGLDISGQNLTNWDSAGYTRQRVEQVAVAPGTYTSRFASNRTGVAGQGVDITGISQTRDVFLDKRFREEACDMGYYTQSSSILADIQSALNEYNPDKDTGLRACLMSMSDALQEFSTHAYSDTHANIVTTEFKNLTQTLQQLSGKLKNAAEQQKYDLSISVEEVNKKLQQLAGLNETIAADMGEIRDNPYFGPNELLDERNRLLDELSQYADISYQSNADGSINVTVNGQPAVNGNKAFKMELVPDEDTGTVGLRWTSTNDPVNLGSGALKASLDFINGRGPGVRNPGETGSRGVLYYQDQLDKFAQTLADAMNHIIPDEVDADGNVVSYRQLLGGLSGEPDPADGLYHVRTDIPITADNLSISDAWSKNPSYIIYQTDSSDGNYALALSNALTSDKHSFDENTSATFLDFVKGYASTLGEDVSFHENRLAASSSISDELQDSRDSVSGVVVDEEVANVMLYQKSLAAASRLMTAMDEALDVLINKTGLVGR